MFDFYSYDLMKILGRHMDGNSKVVTSSQKEEKKNKNPIIII